MKRIAYILTNNEGKIFSESYGENKIFTSEKKAQKQIHEQWEVKKIVLDSYSRLQQHNQFWREKDPDTAFIKIVCWFALFVVCGGLYGYLTINPLLGMQADPKIQEILIFNTFLAGMAITVMLAGALKILKRFVFFMWDIRLWIKYKKENTEGLETFHMLQYMLLTKIEEGERRTINSQLIHESKSEKNNETSNKNIE